MPSSRVTAVIHYLVPQSLNYFWEAWNLLQHINSYIMGQHDGSDLYDEQVIPSDIVLPVTSRPDEQ